MEIAILIGAAVVAVYVLLAYVAAPMLWRHYEHHPSLASAPKTTTTAEGIPGDPLNVGFVGTDVEITAALGAAGWCPAAALGLRSDIGIGAATFDRGVGISHRTGQITHHIAPDVDAERDTLMAAVERPGRVVRIYQVTGAGPTLRGRNGGGDWYYTDGEMTIAVLAKDNRPEAAPPVRLANPPAVAIKNRVWSWMRAWLPHRSRSPEVAMPWWALPAVVVVVWERHAAAETKVEQEANALGDLFRDAQAFPETARDSLYRAIDHYARVVIEDEWDSMALGRAARAAGPARGALVRHLARSARRAR